MPRIRRPSFGAPGAGLEEVVDARLDLSKVIDFVVHLRDAASEEPSYPEPRRFRNVVRQLAETDAEADLPGLTPGGHPSPEGVASRGIENVARTGVVDAWEPQFRIQISHSLLKPHRGSVDAAGDTWRVTGIEPPTRDGVLSRWQAVARGEVEREAMSRWAEPLMFARFVRQPDVLVMQALQYLHGFDMTYRSDDGRMIGHGPPGAYVRTLEEVGQELVAWIERCDAYDADPEGWLAARRAEAKVYVREHRGATDSSPSN